LRVESKDFRGGKEAPGYVPDQRMVILAADGSLFLWFIRVIREIRSPQKRLFPFRQSLLCRRATLTGAARLRPTRRRTEVARLIHRIGEHTLRRSAER
jgi:hypothetical protein